MGGTADSAAAALDVIAVKISSKSSISPTAVSDAVIAWPNHFGESSIGSLWAESELSFPMSSLTTVGPDVQFVVAGVQ